MIDILYNYFQENNNKISEIIPWPNFLDKLKIHVHFKEKIYFLARKPIIIDAYNFLAKTMVDHSIHIINNNPKILGEGPIIESYLIQAEFSSLLSSIQ